MRAVRIVCANVCLTPPLPQFLTPGSGAEVNISTTTRAALQARVASGDVDGAMFDPIVEVCEKEMAGDALPKFVRSDGWRALCDAPASSPDVVSPPLSPRPPTSPTEPGYARHV